jgi:Lon protease-like protein
MAETIQIPLFPLGVVLLPGMFMPLHIFEERYKQMIGECLATGRPFGIVFFDGRAIRKVGCLARVTEVLERHDDGRMDIMTRGGERFVVREWIEAKAYMEGRVVIFDDGEEDGPEELKAVVESAWALLKEMVDVDAGFDSSAFGDRLQAKQLSFALGALEGFSPAERQDLLEMTSAGERLGKCVQALSRIADRNRLTREIKKMIRGNGHPPRRIPGA